MDRRGDGTCAGASCQRGPARPPFGRHLAKESNGISAAFSSATFARRSIVEEQKAGLHQTRPQDGRGFGKGGRCPQGQLDNTSGHGVDGPASRRVIGLRVVPGSLFSRAPSSRQPRQHSPSHEATGKQMGLCSSRVCRRQREERAACAAFHSWFLFRASATDAARCPARAAHGRRHQDRRDRLPHSRR
jgi:hypothetical protein